MKQKTKSTKNLPGIFKKKYTQKKLTKKILKKIYIPEDKKNLESLFVECGQTKKGVVLFAIPKDHSFSKKEIKHFKKIKKDIKKQKGRIKLLPLVAALVFTAAISIGFLLTKNIIVKKAIVTAVQNITEARCDIKEVDFKIFQSTFTLQGLEIANKSSPMKNLISIETINLDFDMLQLLKARFVANDMSVLGVYINNDRTYDGTLPPKVQKKIAKQKAKKEKENKTVYEESKAMQAIKSKSSSKVNTAQGVLTGVLDQYNPETYINAFYEKMESPEVAEQVQKTVEELISRYSTLPGQLESEIQLGQKTVDSVMAIDINAIKNDPLKLKDAVDTLTKAYNSVIQIKNDTEKASKDMQQDVKLTTDLSAKVTAAVAHDQKMLSSEINKITSFTLDDGKQIISGTFDTLAYELLGNYYPYAIKATHYLSNLKNNKKEKKVKTKKATRRAEGQTILYRADNTPQFLIKNISGSGSDFSFQAQNITNEMDKTNKPAAGTVNLCVNGIKNTANLTVDTRSTSQEPLVVSEITSENLPVAFPTSKTGNIPGVPGLESSSGTIQCIFKLFEDEGFSLEGTSILKDAKLTTVAFEPQLLSDMYKNVLAQINTLDFAFTTGFTNKDGFNLNIASSADKQVIAALSKAISNQLSSLKDQISVEMLSKLNEITNGAFSEINSFNDIKNKVDDSKKYADQMAKEIENKRNEAQNMINKGVEDAKKAAQQAAEAEAQRIQAEIEAAARQKEEEVKNQALDAAKNAFKGFF